MSRQQVIVALNENHDASVAIWGPSVPLAALATERVTRTKHDSSGIIRTIDYLLRSLAVSHDDVTAIVRCKDPVALSEQNLNQRLHALNLRFPRAQIFEAPSHHELHALAALQMAPDAKGAILVVDGMGSRLNAPLTHSAFPLYESTTIFTTPPLRRVHSIGTTYSPYRWDEEIIGLGRLYSYVSKHIFGSRYDAGKTMALASYGDASSIKTFLNYAESPRTPYVDGRALTALKPVPVDHTYLDHADLAARAQADVEEAMLALAELARDVVSGDTIFLSGGVALNCPANTMIRDSGMFSRTLVHPAATDDGISLGGIVFGALSTGLSGLLPQFTTAFLGPPIHSVRARLANAAAGTGLRVRASSADRLLDEVVRGLRKGRLVSLYTSASEFGPRALGHRSLLADPRTTAIRDHINQTVKGRESFRPLAPVILQDRASEYFDVAADYHSPYMLLVARAKDKTRSLCPAIVHVDGTSRVQTVIRGQEPLLLSSILECAENAKMPPILLNTSLNGPGQPIVETPEEAFSFFRNSEIDMLFSDGILISKE